MIAFDLKRKHSKHAQFLSTHGVNRCVIGASNQTASKAAFVVSILENRRTENKPAQAE